MVHIVKDYLRIAYKKPGDAYVGLVQRLDRPVGGVMVMAKTSKAFERLQSQMKAREVNKYYLAVSNQAPPQEEDLLHHWLLKNDKVNRTSVYEEEVEGSKESKLIYKLLGEHEGRYLFQIKLITGRSHQIRSQMAHIGCPLLGDVKYGHPMSKLGYYLALYAFYLQFTHPVTKEELSFFNLPRVKEYWVGFEEIFPTEKPAEMKYSSSL